MPIGKLLASMAAPMILSMLVQALYNVVDSIYVSRIGENALTAVSLAFPIQNLTIAVASGLAVGVNALLSRSLGSKDYETVQNSAGSGLFLSFCGMLIFVLFGLFGARPFLSPRPISQKLLTVAPSISASVPSPRLVFLARLFLSAFCRLPAEPSTRCLLRVSVPFSILFWIQFSFSAGSVCRKWVWPAPLWQQSLDRL